MQSGKAQVQEVGGHAAEDQKQIETSNMWINQPGSVQRKFYSYGWLTIINNNYWMRFLWYLE